MENLFKLVEQIQEGDTKALNHLVIQFEPKVKSLLKQTHIQNREDLRQVLFLTIIMKSKKYKLDEVPGFDEFMRKSS